MTDIPLTGNTEEVCLAKVMVWLNRNRKTGTLSLATPAFVRKIFLRMGDVIFASSTYEDDRLGEMLLKAGKLTVEQYDESVRILKASKKKQGAILVELGYLTPKELFQGVKYQVTQIIHNMFQVEDGEYEFREGDNPREEVINLKMSIGNLIYDGVKKIDNWTRIRNEMPETDSVFKLSDDPLSLFQDIELTSQDRRIMSLVDGNKTIREIIDNSWMGSFEALKILYVLWSLQMIELVPSIPSEETKDEAVETEETVSLSEILQPCSEEEEELLRSVEALYSRLGQMTLTELLEVDQQCDSETVKKHYYRLAKQFHPDRNFACSDPAMKTKLAAIFDAMTNAYNTLKDDNLREDYFKSFGSRNSKAQNDERMQTDEQFARGVEEMKKGNFWGAIDNFKWVTKLNPKSPQAWNYLSLAYSKIPGRLKEAEDALLTAIKLEPFNADYYTNLGLIYTKAGIKKRAFSNFEKALKINPQNARARKGLEQTRD